jgi:hypothetical protein
LFDGAVKACSYESQYKLDLSSIVLVVSGPVTPSLYNGMPTVEGHSFSFGVGERGVSWYLFNYISNV